MDQLLRSLDSGIQHQPDHQWPVERSASSVLVASAGRDGSSWFELPFSSSAGGVLSHLSHHQPTTAPPPPPPPPDLAFTRPHHMAGTVVVQVPIVPNILATATYHATTSPQNDFARQYAAAIQREEEALLLQQEALVNHRCLLAAFLSSRCPQIEEDRGVRMKDVAPGLGMRIDYGMTTTRPAQHDVRQQVPADPPPAPRSQQDHQQEAGGIEPQTRPADDSRKSPKKRNVRSPPQLQRAAADVKRSNLSLLNNLLKNRNPPPSAPANSSSAAAPPLQRGLQEASQQGASRTEDHHEKRKRKTSLSVDNDGDHDESSSLLLEGATKPRIITEVTDQDILSGVRMRRGNYPPGNKAFLALIKEFHDFYSQAETRLEKMAVVSFLVDKVETEGGRFLRRIDCEYDLQEGVSWIELTREEAMRRTRYALNGVNKTKRQKR